MSWPAAKADLEALGQACVANSAGAILFTKVPATIITSDWRGLARGAKPKRSRS